MPTPSSCVDAYSAMGAEGVTAALAQCTTRAFDAPRCCEQARALLNQGGRLGLCLCLDAIYAAVAASLNASDLLDGGVVVSNGSRPGVDRLTAAVSRRAASRRCARAAGLAAPTAFRVKKRRLVGACAASAAAAEHARARGGGQKQREAQLCPARTG